MNATVKRTLRRMIGNPTLRAVAECVALCALDRVSVRPTAKDRNPTPSCCD